jgi:hypothetical protein
MSKNDDAHAVLMIGAGVGFLLLWLAFLALILPTFQQ